MKRLFEIDPRDYDPAGETVRRPSARGIIFRDEKILVIFSTANHYCKLPGGGIEPGEDAKAAMIREVREETGYTVIPDTVREFGSVRRIQKGKHEPVFIQDNDYFLCEVEEQQGRPELSPQEAEEGFTPVFLALTEAIRVNEEYAASHPCAMMERELGVLRILAGLNPA